MNTAPNPSRTWRCVLVAFLLLFQSMTIALNTQTNWHQYTNLFTGYAEISQDEYSSLVGQATEEAIPFTLKQTDTDKLEIVFVLDQASIVYLSASAGPAPAPFINPLIVRPEDGYAYLLPLIRSIQSDRRVSSAIVLGEFASGQHHFTISQDRSVTLPVLDSLRLRLTRPSSDSAIGVFIAHSPIIRLKNPANVLDDMPMIGYAEIAKDASGFQVTTTIIFSSENGGTMPATLLRSFGRTVDVEWVSRQIFVGDAGRPHLRRGLFQKQDHQAERITQHAHLDGRPVLAVATANNNFSDGRYHLGRWSLPNLLVSMSRNAIYYAPKPVFLPPQQWSQSLLDQIPELQQWSLFELAQEDCLNLGDTSTPQAMALQAQLDIVRQYIHVHYTPRGCSHGQKIALS